MSHFCVSQFAHLAFFSPGNRETSVHSSSQEKADSVCLALGLVYEIFLLPVDKARLPTRIRMCTWHIFVFSVLLLFNTQFLGGILVRREEEKNIEAAFLTMKPGKRA